mmetsp:Transcript_22495/g.46694  ORF Transcript_22495/g.46694 Transcript_22495/m.46694 type:complete len:104 (-) Transcript_22495:889-1200(-)
MIVSRARRGRRYRRRRIPIVAASIVEGEQSQLCNPFQTIMKATILHSCAMKYFLVLMPIFLSCEIRPGHISAECPKPAGNKACYNCGQEGHISKDCPNPRNEE